MLLKIAASARCALGVFYWGAVWTLGAWCESRNDFRSFRVDRIEMLDVLQAQFADEPGRTLADLLRSVQRNKQAL
jgi:predicted DNA-binding transcriptional regulator YafY